MRLLVTPIGEQYSCIGNAILVVGLRKTFNFGQTVIKKIIENNHSLYMVAPVLPI